MLPLAPPAQVLAPPTDRDQPRRVADLLGVPYREDGTQDPMGRWCTFTHPEVALHQPGFNCSGFVVAAARRILRNRLHLDRVTVDRKGDSGPGANLGEDWDFGWDLVLNLSEGRPRRWVLPEGRRPVGPGDARTLRGFRVQDSEAWRQVFPRLKGECFYLATLSRKKGAGLRFHHVAFLLKDADQRVWFYQTLPQGRTHRLQITAPDGFAHLNRMFGAGEWILLLEVDPA